MTRPTPRTPRSGRPLARVVAITLAALLATGLLPVHGGMGPDELIDPIQEGLSEEEREARREAIREAREQAEKRRREQEEAERAARDEAERARSARPYPVRLTEQRCMSCHDAGDFDRETRSWPNWAFTVWRMRLGYGARLDSGEWRVITGHLAETHGVSTPRAAATWTGLALIPTGLAALFWFLIRRRSKKS